MLDNAIVVNTYWIMRTTMPLFISVQMNQYFWLADINARIIHMLSMIMSISTRECCSGST